MEEKIRFPFENVNKSTKEREEKRLRMLNRNNQQFKELSLSTVKKSSVHCLPSLSSSNTFKLAKFVWIIATLTSWFYLAFQIYLSCQFYVSFRVRSSFSKIVDKQMYFPGWFFSSQFKFSFQSLHTSSFYYFKCCRSRNNLQSKSVRWQCCARHNELDSLERDNRRCGRW